MRLLDCGTSPNGVHDVEVEIKQAALEDSVSDILAFVAKGPRSAFPFIFFDPTGWTGFPLELIEPLLKLQPSEALCNFMTNHILRFAEKSDPGTRKSFDRLFGPIDYRAQIAGLIGQDREGEAA